MAVLTKDSSILINLVTQLASPNLLLSSFSSEPCRYNAQWLDLLETNYTFYSFDLSGKLSNIVTWNVCIIILEQYLKVELLYFQCNSRDSQEIKLRFFRLPTKVLEGTQSHLFCCYEINSKINSDRYLMAWHEQLIICEYPTKKMCWSGVNQTKHKS